MDVHSLKVVDVVALTAVLLWLMYRPASAMGIAHNTTITLEYRGRFSYPTWNMDGSPVPVGRLYQFEYDSSTGDLLSILTIDGNETSGVLNVSCRLEGQIVYTERLTIEGPLPAPRNVTISSQNSHARLQWNPPYYTMNQESDVIHVDPHIIHYTVYIFDAYNRSMIHSVNTTETSFTPAYTLPLCPMYKVSAWNAGGEGELSEPVQDSTPEVENINVTITAESGALQFHIEVGVACPSRMPEFFLVTLMSGSETTRHHQRDFTISPPSNVDVCTIQPRISAGNAAGTSSIETVVVVCSGDSTDSTTTSSATTVSTGTGTGTGTGTESEHEGGRQQGFSTTLIAIVIGVIAAIFGTLIAIATVGYICYRKYKRRNSKVDPSDQTDNYYSKSPSLGGPVSLYKPEVPEADYEQTKSRPVTRDPGSVRGRTKSSVSADSTSSNSSGRSDDLLLPPSLPVQVKSPHKGIYADVDPVNQTRVQPPAKEESVLYSQIKHQD